MSRLRRSAFAALAIPTALAVLGPMPAAVAAVGLDPIGPTDIECELEAAQHGGACRREDWVRNEPAPSDVWTHHVAAGPDGRAYAARSLGGQVVVTAHDATSGEELWTTTVDGPLGGGWLARDLHVGGDALVMAGLAWTPETSQDALVVVLETGTGAERWRARHDRVGSADWATASAVSPDGASVYLVGADQVPGSTESTLDGFAAAYDATTGGQRWFTRHERAREFVDVVAGPTGAYAIGDDPAGGTGVVALDAADGSIRWLSQISHGTRLSPEQLALSPDGGDLYARGTAGFGPRVAVKAVVVALDPATGLARGQYRHDSDGLGPTIGNDLVATTDGAFIAGYVYLGLRDRPFVVALSPGGSVRWAREDDVLPGSSGSFQALAVDHTHSAVVATGYSSSSSACVSFVGCSRRAVDAHTVSFDAADGGRRWTARFGQRPDDRSEAASDIAVSSGRVVVAGSRSLFTDPLTGQRVTMLLGYAA